MWEGPAPVSDDEAGRTYDELYSRYFEDESWLDPENAAPPSECDTVARRLVDVDA